MNFANKVILITGAGSGIGQATAEHLAAQGACVIVADISSPAAEETVAHIQQQRGQAVSMPVDVASEDQVAKLIKDIVQQQGRLDYAINNAGIEHEPMALAACTGEMWDKTMAVNLKGVWLCMKYEIRHMLDQQHSGAIVNIASVAGLGGAPKLGPYAASKHGVVGLTRTAAVEYAKKNIRVNAVCPSYTRTRMVERMIEDKPELEAIIDKASPSGRMAEIDEVVNAIVWLCSDASSFVNGQALAVDGGLSAW